MKNGDSVKIYEVANRLRAPEFAPFIEWLANARSQRLEILATCQVENFARLQGEAAVFKEILDMVECSQKILDRMAAQK